MFPAAAGFLIANHSQFGAVAELFVLSEARCQEGRGPMVNERIDGLATKQEAGEKHAQEHVMSTLGVNTPPVLSLAKLVFPQVK